MATRLASATPKSTAPAAPTRPPGWSAKADAWADHLRSTWARCARRDADGVHLPLVNVQRAHWTVYDQITVNTNTWVNALIVDVDHAEAVQRAWACPATPSWVVPTLHGAHVGWLIDPVKRDRPARKPGGTAPITYAMAVAENLRRVLDGDTSYAMRTTRNPLYVGHETQWGDLTPWGLRSLQNALAGVWATGVARRGDGSTGDGRNTRINTLLWRYARDHPGDDLSTTANVLNSMENPPLDQRELDQIVRSVQRGLVRKRRRNGGESIWSHEECVKGGRTRMAQPGAAKAMNAASVRSRRQKSNVLRERAQALQDEGLSLRAIANNVGVSLSTAQRWLAIPTPMPPVLPGGSKWDTPLGPPSGSVAQDATTR